MFRIKPKIVFCTINITTLIYNTIYIWQQYEKYMWHISNASQ